MSDLSWNSRNLERQNLVKPLAFGWTPAHERGVLRWNKCRVDFGSVPHEEKLSPLEIFGGGVRSILGLLVGGVGAGMGQVVGCHNFVSQITAEVLRALVGVPRIDLPLVLQIQRSHDDDAAFGAQRLCGCNPHWIRRVSLDEAIEIFCDIPGNLDARPLFLLDYSLVDKARSRTACHRYVSGARCLLSQHGDDILPEMIQIGSLPDTFIVKRGSAWKWRYAKLVVQCAEFQVLFSYVRVFTCVFLFKPLTFRCTKSAHIWCGFTTSPRYLL